MEAPKNQNDYEKWFDALDTSDQAELMQAAGVKRPFTRSMWEDVDALAKQYNCPSEMWAVCFYGTQGLGKPSLRLEFDSNEELTRFAADKESCKQQQKEDVSDFVRELNELASQSRQARPAPSPVARQLTPGDRTALQELGLDGLAGSPVLDLYKQYLQSTETCSLNVDKEANEFAEVAANKGLPKASARNAYEAFKEAKRGCNTRLRNKLNKFEKWLKESGIDIETLPVSSEELATNEDVYAVWFPMEELATDTERFQNREKEFSQESVQRIVEDFDPNQFDPITVWEDTDGQFYVLSGHSRFEAFHQLDKDKIPAKLFKGNESEAITFAKILANRGQSPETITEDIAAYLEMRNTGASKATLKRTFGRDVNKLEALSHLDSKGKFIQALANPAIKEGTPKIDLTATWTGELAKAYPRQMTPARQSEVFNWLYDSDSEGYRKPKEEFFMTVEAELKDPFKDLEEPLNLKRDMKTGLEARRDTADSSKRLREINQELVRLQRTLESKSIARETRKELNRNVKELLTEKEKIQSGVREVLKTQAALFGIPKNTKLKWKKTMTYRQVKSLLKKAGYTEVPGKGSHIKFSKNGKTVTVVPKHSGDIAPGTYRKIIQQVEAYENR